MIDHVSIAVRDLATCARFYEATLAALGYVKLADRPTTVGFGKRYPEFWLNHRPAMAPVAADSGVHVCLRAPDAEMVDAFHRAAIAAGGTSEGEPGRRPQYHESYYAAFIRDPEGNRIEAVTFLATDGGRKARP
jgi:catechol 2,3-dioxygenase-like lactoylglutathione lyase family enzyme